MKHKAIITALAVLCTGQAFALETTSKDAVITYPHVMTISHELVDVLRNKDLPRIEHRIIRPYARPIHGRGIVAQITARDQAEADWMETALRYQTATAEIIKKVDADAPEVTVEVVQTEWDDDEANAMGAEQASEPETITLQHEFVGQFETFDKYNVDIIFIRQTAKTLRTPDVASVNILARDQAEADLVAFTYQRNGATAPFTMTIDPAAAEVQMTIEREEQ